MWGLIKKLWGKGYGDLSQLGGPIKIAQISGKVAQFGILPFISIIAYISVAIGFVQLFPIPLLDGGHILINSIEGFRKKEFNQKTIENTFRIGLTIIAFLVVFTTYNDLKSLFF